MALVNISDLTARPEVGEADDLVARYVRIVIGCYYDDE